MKPQPSFTVSVRPWLHSDIYTSGFHFLDPDDIKSLSLGAICYFSKEQGSIN